LKTYHATFIFLPLFLILTQLVFPQSVFDNFDRSNRLLNGDVTPSGLTWLCFGAGGSTARIENKMFQADSNTYAQLDYGTPFHKIGGAFSFGRIIGVPNKYSNTLTLIACESAYFGNKFLHLYFSPGSWVLQKVLEGTGGSYIQLASGKMELLTDGTIYNISMEIHGDTCIINPPEGEKVQIIDPDIETIHATHGIWQIGGVPFNNVFIGRWNLVSLGDTDSIAALNDSILPTEFILFQNYPNPFNLNTTISYQLKEEGQVKLNVYDIKGTLLKVLVNGTKETGYYETRFNAMGLASGIYFYKIEVLGKNNILVFSDTKKTILLK
jgi:hypothetical protein